jgi:type IV pilus assembly protein PilB
VGGRRVELGKLETEEFESFLRDAASGDSLPRRIDGVPFEGCDLTVDVLPAGFEDRYVVRGFSNIVLDSLDAIGLDPEVNTQIREDIGRRRGGLWILGAAPRHGAKTTLRALAVECAQKQQIVVSLISPSSAKNRENLIDVSSIASRSAADGFAEAMRHDPDVLVAGRIQDRRAAARAAGAACAGVRVLCAVNATNAAQAFATFRGFGVENTILEQARPIFAAQRLMPALCLLCREPDATAVDQLRKLGFPESELRASTVYKAVGCDKCVEGLRGRFAAMENLSTLAPSAPASEARAGHGSLASSLFRAVARGRSTVAELIRSMEGCGIPCRTQSS